MSFSCVDICTLHFSECQPERLGSSGFHGCTAFCYNLAPLLGDVRYPIYPFAEVFTLNLFLRNIPRYRTLVRVASNSPTYLLC